MTPSRFTLAIVAALAAACADGTGPGGACDGPELLLTYVEGGGRQHVVAMKGDGSGRTVLVPPTPPGEWEGMAAAWSPDGCRIAYAAGTQLFVARADGSRPRAIFTGSVPLDYPAWRPDGREIAFTRGYGPGSRAWRVRTDGSDARPLTAEVLPTGAASWSSDGRLIAYARSVDAAWHTWRVVVMNADGTGAREIASPAQPGAAWVPGAHRLAYSTAMTPGDAAAGYALRTVAADGSDDRLLVGSLPVLPFDLAWTPAGDSLSFAGSGVAGGGIALYLVSAAGTGLRQIVAAPWAARPSWRR